MFTKDSRAETFLTQMGVEFSYTNDIAFSKLVDGWEKKNLARPVPIRDDAVLEYSTLMTSGSPAPAPILLETPKGKLEVLDGVQRLAAAQLASSTRVSAYVVRCDSLNITSAIRVLANSRLQGRAEPSEWTRRRAVEVLVLQRRMSIEEVARMGGWSPKQVSDTARIIGWADAIMEIGGPELPDVLADVVSKHAPKDELVKCPKPIAEFLNVVKEAKFSAADAEPHVADFFKKTNKKRGVSRHAEYGSRLQEFRSNPEVEARIKGRKSSGIAKDVLLRRAMKATIGILDDMILDGAEVVFMDEFFKLLNETERRLRRLSKSPAPAVSRVPADRWKK